MTAVVVFRNPLTGTRMRASGNNIALLSSWGWVPVDDPTPDFYDPFPGYMTESEAAASATSGTGTFGTALRAAAVTALEEAAEVVPTGAWDFSGADVTGIVGVSFVVLTGTPTADTAAIQAAINAGGHIFLVGHGGVFTVNPLLMKTGAHLDLGGSTLKLANGANADLISVPNFSTLDAGNTSGGETKWSIRNGVLDGNGTNQTGTSWTFRVYAYNYRVDNVELVNGLSGNVYSKWGNSAGGNMEAVWTRFKLLAPVGDTAVNLDWNGPHDSIFEAGEVVAANNAITLHQTGIWSRGNAGGEQFVNVHVWGFHQYGWIADHSLNAINCDAEGAWAVNVLLRAGSCRFYGRVFGTNGVNASEVGVQIGDATHTSIKNCDVNVMTYNWAAGAFPFAFPASGSGGRNRYGGAGILGGATAPFSGSLNAADRMEVLFQDGTEDQSKMQIPQPLAIRSSSTSALTVGQLSYNATNFILDLRGGGFVRGYKSDNTTQTWRLDQSTGGLYPGNPAGVSNGGIFGGAGAPTFSAVAGSKYWRSDGAAGSYLYHCTGGTSWTAIL